MTTLQRIVTFQGTVRCRRAPGTPGLALTGIAEGGDTVLVVFSGGALADLPPELNDVAVDRIAPDQFRLVTREREWIIQASAVHLHREIGADFYRVIRPRVPSWSKRLLLEVLANPVGSTVVLWLRG
jgi:hypothetical protein